MRKLIISIVMTLCLVVPSTVRAQASVVAQKKSQLGLGSNLSPQQLDQLLRSVAADVGGGLLVKTSGTQCLGHACDIICFQGGDAFDILGDSDGAAIPQWNDIGPTPGACDIIPRSSGGGTTNPPPSSGVTTDQLNTAIAELRASTQSDILSLQARIQALEARPAPSGSSSGGISVDQIQSLIETNQKVLAILIAAATKFGMTSLIPK